MDDRPQTYALDPNNPNLHLIRRILRISSVIEVIVGVALFAAGILPLVPFIAFLGASLITAIIIPAALGTLPGSVSVDPAGLTIAGRRYANTIPWADIASIEVINAASEPNPWIFELLRISRNRDFVRVHLKNRASRDRAVRASSSGVTTFQNRLTLYLEDPYQFADAANELREQA